MFLDEYTIFEESSPEEMDAKKFNHKYMTKNRPVVVRAMAKNWGAVSKWSDFEYLKENAGTSTSLVSVLGGKIEKP